MYIPTDDDDVNIPVDDEVDVVPPDLQDDTEDRDVSLDEKTIYGESDTEVDHFSQDINERYNDDEDA